MIFRISTNGHITLIESAKSRELKFLGYPLTSISSRLVIMSPDENTKYLDFDLKVGGECTTDMCNMKTARVGFQGFTGLSAKIYDFLVQDRYDKTYTYHVSRLSQL